jgi:hypothetical protein
MKASKQASVLDEEPLVVLSPEEEEELLRAAEEAEDDRQHGRGTPAREYFADLRRRTG